MLWHLVHKELLEQLVSLRFAMACVICLVIAISSAVVLTKDYKEAQVDYRTSTVIHENELKEGGKTGRLWHDGLMVDRPMNPLQIFVQGVEQELTTSVHVTLHEEPALQPNQVGNPAPFLFPAIDVLAFIGVVMSLLALAFGYDAVSGEKESGTLKTLLSYAAPRDTILLAKWFGGYLALAAPFLVSVVCAVGVVALFPEVELRDSDWLGVACLLGVGMIYLAAMYSMAVFVSTRTHLASTSITVLLLIWVLMIFVMPNVSPYVAEELVSVSDFTQINRQKRVFRSEQEERFERTVEAYRAAHPDVEPWGRDGVWDNWFYPAERERVLELIDTQRKIDAQFNNQLAEQISVAKHLSRLSPFSSFAYAAVGLAGTGIDEHHRFRASLDEYRRELTPYIAKVWHEWRREDYTDRPRYVHLPTPIGDRLDAVLVDVLLLMGWSVVFFLGAYLSFLRYDVR